MDVKKHFSNNIVFQRLNERGVGVVEWLRFGSDTGSTNPPAPEQETGNRKPGGSQYVNGRHERCERLTSVLCCESRTHKTRVSSRSQIINTPSNDYDSFSLFAPCVIGASNDTRSKPSSFICTCVAETASPVERLVLNTLKLLRYRLPLMSRFGPAVRR